MIEDTTMRELDCTDIKAVLSGMIDGELDDETRHAAERHLASCRDCRDIVNEAERVSSLVALEAQRGLWPVGLPQGFEEAVLSETVYAGTGRRWTSWLGWAAAAACLIFAGTIWFVDNSRESGAPGDFQAAGFGTTIVRTPYLTTGRSWTYDGALSPEVFGREAAPEPAEEPTVVQTAVETTDTLAQLSSQSSLTAEQEHVLYATSVVLQMLVDSDRTTFADLDRIRRIVEYDNLLPRLAEVRARVNPTNRPVVLAAESVLHRIARGPIDLDDLNFLHDTVSTLELSSHMNTLSNRGRTSPTL